MGDWDSFDFQNGNGMVFKGALDPNHYDTLFAYTLGDKAKGWISVTAVNLQHLLDETEKKSKQTQVKDKKKKNQLVVSVPPAGGLGRWFDLLKTPKNILTTLRIYIYADGNKVDHDPDAWLVFSSIKMVGDGKPAKLFDAFPINRELFRVFPMPATFFVFEYDSMKPYKRF